MQKIKRYLVKVTVPYTATAGQDNHITRQYHYEDSREYVWDALGRLVAASDVYIVQCH